MRSLDGSRATHTRAARSLSIAGRITRWANLSMSMRLPLPVWNMTPVAGLCRDARYWSRILASFGITGTGWRLARVFGWLTIPFQTERFTASISTFVIRPFQPTQLALAKPGKRRRRDDSLGKQWEDVQNPENLHQVVSVSLLRLACLAGDHRALNRVGSVKRAFVLRIREDSAEHGLKCISVVFVRSHSPAIARSILLASTVLNSRRRISPTRFRM